MPQTAENFGQDGAKRCREAAAIRESCRRPLRQRRERPPPAVASATAPHGGSLRHRIIFVFYSSFFLWSVIPTPHPPPRYYSQNLLLQLRHKRTNENLSRRPKSGEGAASAYGCLPDPSLTSPPGHVQRGFPSRSLSRKNCDYDQKQLGVEHRRGSLIRSIPGFYYCCPLCTTPHRALHAW